MARQYRLHHQLHAEHDIWSETWGDQALQELGRRLVAAGLASEQTALALEQIWLFYSYVTLPTLGERVPLGIAV